MHTIVFMILTDIVLFILLLSIVVVCLHIVNVSPICSVLKKILISYLLHSGSTVW